MSRILAEEAALNSARISGYDPHENGDEMYAVHCKLLEDVLGCTTGALTHPIIINTTLCGDRGNAQYRRGIRAAEAGLLPDATHVRRFLRVWWIITEWEVSWMRGADTATCEAFCWAKHDFLVCLEPFARANGRTARIVYYMLATALCLPVHVILAEKARTYSMHQQAYREAIFVPEMMARGFIA